VAGTFSGPAPVLDVKSAPDRDLYVLSLNAARQVEFGAGIVRPGVDGLASVDTAWDGTILVSGFLQSGLLAAAFAGNGQRLWTRESYSPAPFEKPGIFARLGGTTRVVLGGSLVSPFNFGDGVLTPAGGPGLPDVFLAAYDLPSDAGQ
jgi:hypothetical protein